MAKRNSANGNSKIIVSDKVTNSEDTEMQVAPVNPAKGLHKVYSDLY